MKSKFAVLCVVLSLCLSIVVLTACGNSSSNAGQGGRGGQTEHEGQGGRGGQTEREGQGEQGERAGRENQGERGEQAGDQERGGRDREGGRSGDIAQPEIPVGPTGVGAEATVAQAVSEVAESAEQAAGEVSEALPTDYDANQAVSRYAADVLGINVEIVSSGGQEGTVDLPSSMQGDVDAAVSLSGVTYAAVLRSGTASLSLGAGTISGDLNADIQNASLGAYALLQSGSAPTDEAGALALLKATYPGIADLPYILKEVSGDAPTGQTGGGGAAGGRLQGQGGQLPVGEGQTYIFIAQTQQTEVDVRSGEAKVIAVVALVGVTAGGPGQIIAFATVGKGDLAAAIR